MTTQHDQYIPAQRTRTELMVANSRFICTVIPVQSVEEAKAELHAIRAEMPDATHHVYAFRIGHGNSIIEGMSDDGEPSGTAGPPVLAVLRGTGLGDVLVVVTRYFGGTKLGTGGLVRAYSDSARAGLENTPRELKIERRLLGIELPYGLYEQAKRLIEAHEGIIEDQTFTETVTVIARFKLDTVKAFTAALADLSAGQVEPVILDD
ncbi:MAG TPA: YigZ family protein [Spirillospora sp.]|nr:MAG: YigZ family protein [Chloroflexota bacterium]HLV33462.1 YigZ family protein [Spirillospora sp.]